MRRSGFHTASVRPVVIRPVGDCVWPTEQLWSMVRTDHDEPDEDPADYESEGRLVTTSARFRAVRVSARG
jgi:hypothetical protein